MFPVLGKTSNWIPAVKASEWSTRRDMWTGKCVTKGWDNSLAQGEERKVSQAKLTFRATPLLIAYCIIISPPGNQHIPSWEKENRLLKSGYVIVTWRISSPNIEDPHQLPWNHRPTKEGGKGPAGPTSQRAVFFMALVFSGINYWGNKGPENHSSWSLEITHGPKPRINQQKIQLCILPGTNRSTKIR